LLRNLCFFGAELSANEAFICAWWCVQMGTLVKEKSALVAGIVMKLGDDAPKTGNGNVSAHGVRMHMQDLAWGV